MDNVKNALSDWQQVCEGIFQRKVSQITMKVQNKLVKCIEEQSSYASNREEFKTLGEVCKQESASADIRAKLKSLRSQILRFSKGATMLVNALCERIVSELLAVQSADRTLDWKYFDAETLSLSFVGGLIAQTPTARAVLDIKQQIHNIDTQREIARLSTKSNPRPQKRSVMSELTKLKAAVKSEVESSADKSKQARVQDLKARQRELQQQIDAATATQEGTSKVPQLMLARETLNSELQSLKRAQSSTNDAAPLRPEAFANFDPQVVHIYTQLEAIHQPTEQSKHAMGWVKNCGKKTKVLQDQSAKSFKVASSYKVVVARVLAEFLALLAQKIDVYVATPSKPQAPIRTVKVDDLSKIIRISTTLNASFDEFARQFIPYDSKQSKRVDQTQ